MAIREFNNINFLFGCNLSQDNKVVSRRKNGQINIKQLLMAKECHFQLARVLLPVQSVANFGVDFNGN